MQHHPSGQRQGPLYSPEKILADLLRNGRFTGRDVLPEGVQYALKRQERDLKQRLEAATIRKVAARIEIYVEALVNDSGTS